MEGKAYMHASVALIGLAGEFEVGFAEAPALLDEASDRLASAGIGLAAPPGLIHSGETVARVAESLVGKEFDAYVACVATWSEDHHLLDLLAHFDAPVILWAFPGVHTGSLCGAHQIASVLKELDKPCFFAYGHTGDPAALRRVAVAARATALKRKIEHVCVGTVGGRVKGMADIACDELEIKRSIGARIVNLDESELKAAWEATPVQDAEAVWRETAARAGSVEVARGPGLDAARWYLAMKRVIAQYALEGICIKCYPGFMGRVCLGFTLLSEEGIVCGCEGDVTGTVAMKLLRELTGAPVHNTDLLHPDPVANTILFSHCGSGAFSLAASQKEVRLAPVRLAGGGVCTLFTARPGPVTLVNLVGRRGTMRLSTLAGEAVPCGMEFPGNPLKVKFERGVQEIVEHIAQEGVGHHWMACYGDVTAELQVFCALKGIRNIDLTRV